VSPSAVTAPPPAPSPSTDATPARGGRRPDSAWAAVALITAVAAALRLVHLGAVTVDPFYDAAVRSMGLSWHNFLLGAFEPGGTVAVDKPPLDLWLQVASVKLFGFGSTTLKLPEALAGTASVPLIFAVVRRTFSTRAGLAAAAAMAVLPIEVLTSRSDTMDGVMMALIVLGLLLVVRAAETGATRCLLLAAAVLGLAFNVKLFESMIPLPAFALLAYLGLPGTGRRRLAQLATAGAVYLVVALSWLGATLLVPAHDRPFAIGSTNGSAWNAAFVFNGTDRLSGKAQPGDQAAYSASQHYPVATQGERDRVPITPPSVTRLLDRVGPLSGERLGFELLAALLLGVPALIGVLRRRERASGEVGTPAIAAARVQRATAWGLLVWLGTGVVLFSAMARLHPRYVEGFTPAVAAVLGIGIAWAAAGGAVSGTPVPGARRSGHSQPGERPRTALLAIALVLLVVYAERLLYGAVGVWWITLAAALGALALGGLLRMAPSHDAARRSAPARVLAGVPRELAGAVPRAALAGGLLALTLVAILAIPLKASIDVISERASDAGRTGATDPSERVLISHYLRVHQGNARYEVAAASATKASSLIVADARPIVVLTTYNALTLTSVAQLQRLIAEGQVRYALIDGACGPHTARTSAACAPPVVWVRAHGTDVSRRAGLTRANVLWRLPNVVA
jgi:4-amino-4-deoxy-L-arabinose transferase-like glycosyltransferase